MNVVAVRNEEPRIRGRNWFPSESTTTTTEAAPKTEDLTSSAEVYFSRATNREILKSHLADTYRDFYRAYKSYITDLDPTAVASKNVFQSSNYLQGSYEFRSVIFHTLGLDNKMLWDTDLKFRTLRNQAAIVDVMTREGFDLKPSYTDKRGGVVVDFIRGSDRLTLVFTEESTQILSRLADKITEAALTGSRKNQVSLRRYVENLLRK
jgi:hypothetical protein